MIFVCAALLYIAAPSAYAITIVNSVSSYANTGGKSAVDGRDGEDGADGEDGEAGEDGQSFGSAGSQSTNGTASASVRIESYVDGEKVIDLHEEIRSDEPLQNANEKRSLSAGPDETKYFLDLSAAADIQSERYSPRASAPSHPASFLGVLSSIRLTLLSYVNKFF